MSGGAHPAFERAEAVGKSLPRPDAPRRAAGRGRYADDIVLPRMAHVAFLRSPHAHARIRSIDAKAAAALPGVIRIATGAEIEALCAPFRTVLAHAPDHVSPPQAPLAVTIARWAGEAVVAVVAESRALAEDAIERIEIDWQPLPAVATAEAALAPGAPLVHPELGHNLLFERRLGPAEIESALAAGECLVTREFVFGRHTGVPLEARCILADYNPAEDSLTVYQSGQVPHQMQDLLSRHLGIPENRVRVICPDVGGAFGIKMHGHPDELATAALSKLLGRPVKFTGDRAEAFLSDNHARDFRIAAQLAARRDGTIAGIDADSIYTAGAYSIYPRGSISDGLQTIALPGAVYRTAALRGRLRVVFQNKVPVGQYRGVGQPIATAVTEQLVDDAAARLGVDPVEFRRRALHDDEALPLVTPGGIRLAALSLGACLERMVELAGYERLRAEQAAMRRRGIWRGIGVAPFIELTAIGPWSYGNAGVRVSAQDGATVKLDPSGTVRCAVGCTDQGQGTATGIAQIVADAVGIDFDRVTVETGDSAGPYGGGAWASRGLSIGGEAAYAAATQLRDNLLALAAALVQTRADALAIRAGVIVDRASGAARMTLAELGTIAHFRPDQLPPGLEPRLSATHHYTPRDVPYFVANGVQASHVEIDVETGAIRLLGHWVVDDCGRAVNPLLIDEQIRGGVVQGLGAVLFEECLYDEAGQLLTGTLADYLVPMAGEMPDIAIAHIETPQPGTALGIKGVGEAGTVGAYAALWCAVNDALRPLGAAISRQPFTPERVLAALGKVGPPLR
jgi:carbon-monoxide dehydrogenase large subunit